MFDEIEMKEKNYKPDYKHLPPLGYDFLTSLYDYFCAVVGLGKGFKNKIVSSVNLKGNERILDVGCGTGMLLEALKRKYPNIKAMGIDPDRKALEIAARRLGRNGFDVELKQAFAESLPVDAESIDFAFSSLAFHHIPHSKKLRALKEAYRVLKSDGRFLIVDLNEGGNPLFRFFSFVFEEAELIKDNIKNLTSEFLPQAGFRNIRALFKHSWGIQGILAEK